MANDGSAQLYGKELDSLLFYFCEAVTIET